MADYRRNEIVSGLFIAGAVAVFALFAFQVGGADLFGLLRPESRRFRAYFADVKSLDQGAKVTIAGRRVGTVTALRLADRSFSAQRVHDLTEQFGAARFPGLEAGMVQQQIEVAFALDDHAVRIDPQTARVTLLQDGFLGRHYLALDPGYWSADHAPQPLLELAADRPHDVAVQETAGLDLLIASLQPAVRKIDALLDALQTQVLNDEGAADARRAIAELADAMGHLNALLDRSRPDSLHQMVVEPLRRVLENADGSVGDLRARLLPRAEAALDQWKPLVDDARGAIASAAGMLDENRPRIAGILTELERATADLDGDIAAMRADLQRLLVELGDAVTENRPELAETMRRLRRTMWQAEMAMRKIRANPAYLLFGDSETDLEAQPRDLSETWRTGRARPYQQRDEGDGR